LLGDGRWQQQHLAGTIADRPPQGHRPALMPRAVCLRATYDSRAESKVVMVLTAVTVVRERKRGGASKGDNDGSRYWLPPGQDILGTRFACRRATVGSFLAQETARDNGAQASNREGVCPAPTHGCVHVLWALGLPK